MPSEKNKRSLYATEAVAGAGLAAASASDRIPEVVNGAVRLKRRSDLWHAETRLKAGLGKTPDGRYVPYKTMDPRKPKKGKPVFMHNGRPISFSAETRKSPRIKGRQKVREEYRAAYNKVHSPNHVPFPEDRWQRDPITHKKITHTLDPKTGKMVRTGASLGEMRRFAVVGAGVPLGIVAGWHGAHKYMSLKDKQRKRVQMRLKPAPKNQMEDGTLIKRLDQSDVDGAIAGGLTGMAVYQAPSFTEWAGRGKHDEKLTEAQKKIVNDWKTEYGVHGAQKGTPKWKKAYRNYPKTLPRWKVRRLQSHIYTGKTGMALTGGAGVIGAAAGVPTVRAINRKFKDK